MKFRIRWGEAEEASMMPRQLRMKGGKLLGCKVVEVPLAARRHVRRRVPRANHAA